MTGETSADLRLLEKGDVIVGTPTQTIVCVTLFSVKALTLRCCSGMFRTWDFSLLTKFRWLAEK